MSRLVYPGTQWLRIILLSLAIPLSLVHDVTQLKYFLASCMKLRVAPCLPWNTITSYHFPKFFGFLLSLVLKATLRHFEVFSLVCCEALNVDYCSVLLCFHQGAGQLWRISLRLVFHKATQQEKLNIVTLSLLGNRKKQKPEKKLN